MIHIININHKNNNILKELHNNLLKGEIVPLKIDIPCSIYGNYEKETIKPITNIYNYEKIVIENYKNYLVQIFLIDKEDQFVNKQFNKFDNSSNDWHTKLTLQISSQNISHNKQFDTLVKTKKDDLKRFIINFLYTLTNYSTASNCYDLFDIKDILKNKTLVYSWIYVNEHNYKDKIINYYKSELKEKEEPTMFFIKGISFDSDVFRYYIDSYTSGGGLLKILQGKNKEIHNLIADK